MSGPRKTPEKPDGAEKRELDDALEEGLEETFPGLRPRQRDSAGSEQGRSSCPTEALAPPPL